MAMKKDLSQGRAANSFRDDEVNVANQLFATVRRGGDVRALMKTEAYRSLERKFLLMSGRTTHRSKKPLVGLASKKTERIEIGAVDDIELAYQPRRV